MHDRSLKLGNRFKAPGAPFAATHRRPLRPADVGGIRTASNDPQAAHPSYESCSSTDSLVVSSVPTPAEPECSQFCALPACGRICVNSEFPFQPNINGITKKLVKSTEKVQRRNDLSSQKN